MAYGVDRRHLNIPCLVPPQHLPSTISHKRKHIHTHGTTYPVSILLPILRRTNNSVIWCRKEQSLDLFRCSDHLRVTNVDVVCELVKSACSVLQTGSGEWTNWHETVEMSTVFMHVGVEKLESSEDMSCVLVMMGMQASIAYGLVPRYSSSQSYLRHPSNAHHPTGIPNDTHAVHKKMTTHITHHDTRKTLIPFLCSAVPWLAGL